MDSLTDLYKKDTPGQPVSVRDSAGIKRKVPNVPIRMADGSIRKLPPGKSGSSGGGGE